MGKHTHIWPRATIRKSNACTICFATLLGPVVLVSSSLAFSAEAQTYTLTSELGTSSGVSYGVSLDPFCYPPPPSGPGPSGPVESLSGSSSSAGSRIRHAA